mmetsp:Transcript_15722/g.61408  ORF Transcript_15722/g.61408 Transcript_15722/m.61408 type:complete len:446 (-) Transcript_15722:46-1383(-)
MSLPFRAGYDAAAAEATQELDRSRVLAMRLPWDQIHGAGTIDADQLELIRQYDKRPLDMKKTFVDERPAEYAALFMTLVGYEQLTAKIERLQYALSLIDELLSDDESFVSVFLEQADPYSPFTRILNTKSDVYTLAKASRVLALLLIKSAAPPQEAVRTLVQFCGEQLREERATQNRVALGALQTLLRAEAYRALFHADDGVNKLKRLLNAGLHNSQVVYQALHCLWLLSYSASIAAAFHRTTIIPRIVEVLRDVPKEKVTRVALATLRNIAGKDEENMNNAQMMDAGVMRVLENLQQKNWADQDLTEDLEALVEQLQANIVELTSWDKYKQEVLAGDLQWSPVHKSDRFWRENVLRFEEENFQLLRILIDVIKSPQSRALALEVACHDVGEFVRFHPCGRTLVSRMAGKVAVMLLMDHQDASVQKQALLCTQKLLTTNWEHMVR